jgi:hypothetical protein
MIFCLGSKSELIFWEQKNVAQYFMIYVIIPNKQVNPRSL